MKLEWLPHGQEEPATLKLDDGVKDVEFKEVFTGVTFVSADDERLSVVMRDSGFEMHYYTDARENGFDAGWFRFNAGVVNVPEYIASPLAPQEGYTAPYESHLDHKRLEAWNRATAIVDEIAIKHPLEQYRHSGNVVNIGPMMTAADQRASLIREVANWLLGEDD